MHSAERLSEAINASLAQMGEYTGVSRVYTFEKSTDGATFSNTFEWCNEGVIPVIDDLQDLPVELAKSWFDTFDAGGYICTSDIKTLVPDVAERMADQGIKSIVVLPLTSYDYHYGFVGFDECISHREWSEEEVALLKNLSKILSTSTQRYRVERNLRSLSLRQALFIKVLQILQLQKDLPTAMNRALAEIGEYTGVSRVYTFEKSTDGATFSNTFEWCNEGVVPVIDDLQDLPVELAQSWFDAFEAGGFICTDDVNTLVPDVAERMAEQGIKSLVVLPLTSYDYHYGFVGFDECAFHREWSEEEVALLKNLSKILSTSTQRYRAEKDLRSLSRRQALFIKVLQTLQLEDDLQKAMDMALAEIGEYTNVSRMQIWENNPDGLTYGVSYEWCNEGVEPAIHYLKTIPIEYGKPWFDMLLAERMICTSDISTLHPAMIEILQPQGVQSIVVLPLAEYGKFFGYIAFTVTEVRKWEKEDVELLKNIAQIVSTASKRYQAETVIKQSQQVMRTVLDNINSNIFVTDCETSKILFANKSFKQETGKDVEGEICWHALQAGLTGECRHCPKAMLLDEHKRPNDVVHFWEDYNPNTKRWYSIASKALEWVNGRPAIMELATNATDRKLAETELIRAREKAEESDNLKSAFLANMSHEIRTPVNGITGFLQFLNDDNLAPQRRKEYINVINNSSVQLVKLIDDIIDVAKIEARQMSINPVPVHLNSLMNELHLFFETWMKTGNKEHISLILDTGGFIDNCIAYVDSIRLRQIITNLINNAVKYTEKGYIRFGYRHLLPDKLEFVVEDTGVGMKPEHREIIFERFRQAESTNSRLYGGAGLGLSISRSLVQMMGGDLRVVSTEGEGSSFYFTVSYLPVAPESEHKT
jgi:signal transduction histidine kinase/transcriptional regulator with GAF, ATPase, and Fis domain